MSADLWTTTLTGVLPLVGVLIGAGSAISVQRNSTRTSRLRFAAESQHAHRVEVKAAIVSYLEIVQQLQTSLDAREHLRSNRGSLLKRPRHENNAQDSLLNVLERTWLAYKQIDIICSQQLRKPLFAHTQRLQKVARDSKHPDYWASLRPLQAELMEAIRVELSPAHDWENVIEATKSADRSSGN